MNLILLEQIKKSIPSCRDKIIELLSIKEQDYKLVGGDLTDLQDLENNHGALLLSLINKYTESYQAIISKLIVYVLLVHHDFTCRWAVCEGHN